MNNLNINNIFCLKTTILMDILIELETWLNKPQIKTPIVELLGEEIPLEWSKTAK